MRKRILCVLVIAVMSFSMSYSFADPTNSVGLLNGKEITLSAGNFSDVGKDTAMTDEDVETFTQYWPNNGDGRVSNGFIDLGANYTITDYSQKSERSLVYTFSDENKQQVGSLLVSETTDGKTTLANVYEHVRYVNWGDQSRNSNGNKVYEVNVYGFLEKAEEPPAEPYPNEPEETSGDILLTLYLVNGQTKEYELSQTQLNSFYNWFDQRSEGSGLERYEFKKDWNKGEFRVRREFVIYDKIVNFDVDEYRE